MLISTEIRGNIYNAGYQQNSKSVDYLSLEWFDTTKRIIRDFSIGRREIGFRNLTSDALRDGDVLYEDKEVCIVVKILACLCIVLQPVNATDMAVICFEIGNKHVPIFINSQNEIIIAYEKPLYEQLARAGYQPKKEERIIEKTDTLMIHHYGGKKNKIVLVKEE